MKQNFGGKSHPPLPWQPLPYMEEFLDNLRADDKNVDYIRMCKVALAHFSQFAATEGIKHPDEITRAHILRFQVYLTQLVNDRNGEPLSLSYRQRLMEYLRTWIHWCVDLEHITVSPWVRIRVGRVKKKPKPLEDVEIEQVFDAHRMMAFSMSPFLYHRREVILVLLYGWGLRIHELQALSLADMDMRLDYVIAKNKGGGTKTLPYSQEMKNVVQRYLIQRGQRPNLPGVSNLLIDQQGNELSIEAIRKIVTDLGARAGVTINPHRMRDTFGTKMLDADVPVERIMVMLGHTQRSQTLAYSRLNDPKLKESHDAVMDPLIKKLTGG